MKFKISKTILIELLDNQGMDKLDGLFDRDSRWSSEVEMSSNVLSIEELDKIEALALKDEDNNKDFLRNYKRFKALHKKGGLDKLKRLMDLPESLKIYVENNLPNSRVYQVVDEQLVPYMITDVKYEPYDARGETPAHVTMYFSAIRFGETTSRSSTIWSEDLSAMDGMNAVDMLTYANVEPEDEDLNAQYQLDLEKYKDLKDRVGQVYVGENVGAPVDDGYRASKFYFKQGCNSKVVIDFFGRKILSNNKLEDLKEERVISDVLGNRRLSPIQTFGEVFHLEEHVWIQMHVANLKPYEFRGKSMQEKLILPQSHKELIYLLMQMSKLEIEDIVEGKVGGSFIMATGTPGTGKTLTAEVFSEVIEKPLYKVQCSQLGLSVDDVEKKLKNVLRRASRWGAILLIDEADVYVRQRGSDINQNAIVGVFLRTLEYYRGILFMTSNVGSDIDDAIMSRATAHLEYEIPSREDQARIWKVLSTQFQMKLSDSEINKLTDIFPRLVGRDVKALLKLSKMVLESKLNSTDASDREAVIVDVIKMVSKFIPNVNTAK